MSNGKNKYEILPAGEMQGKYGLFVENWKTIALDPARVPEALLELLPWAARFGIGDDIVRADAIDKLPLKLAQDLVVAVSPYLEQIQSWARQEPHGRITDEMAAYLALALLCDDVQQQLTQSPVMKAAIARRKAEISGETRSDRVNAIDDVNRALDRLEKTPKDEF